MNVSNPGEAPTKELYVPATYDFGAGAAMYGHGDTVPCVSLSGLNDRGMISFVCPHDFNVIISAVVICIPKITQALANWGYQIMFGGEGQAYNTHNVGDSAATYDVTANEYFNVDVAPNLGDLVAGDRAGIAMILEDALHDFYVVGFKLRYT